MELKVREAQTKVVEILASGWDSEHCKGYGL